MSPYNILIKNNLQFLIINISFLSKLFIAWILNHPFTYLKSMSAKRSNATIAEQENFEPNKLSRTCMCSFSICEFTTMDWYEYDKNWKVTNAKRLVFNPIDRKFFSLSSSRMDAFLLQNTLLWIKIPLINWNKMWQSTLTDFSALWRHKIDLTTETN